MVFHYCFCYKNRLSDPRTDHPDGQGKFRQQILYYNCINATILLAESDTY